MIDAKNCSFNEPFRGALNVKRVVRSAKVKRRPVDTKEGGNIAFYTATLLTVPLRGLKLGDFEKKVFFFANTNLLIEFLKNTLAFLFHFFCSFSSFS